MPWTPEMITTLTADGAADVATPLGPLQLRLAAVRYGVWLYTLTELGGVNAQQMCRVLDLLRAEPTALLTPASSRDAARSA